MKCQVALLLVGFVALSSAYSYVPPMRKTLQSIPIPKNYQQQKVAVEIAPASGAPGGAAYDELPAAELPQEPEPIQVNYQAPPARMVERAPVRQAVPSAYPSEETRAPLPRREYAPVVEEAAAPPPRRAYASEAVAPPARQAYAPVAARQSPKAKPQEEEDLSYDEEEFAKNAQYSFATAVDDGIQDQSQIRQETRDGTKVSGTYAYSDGYFKRTVNYEADENGYRVVSESVEPLGEEGPQVDLVRGKAEVHTQIAGVNTQYGVSADELAFNSKKAKDLKDDKEGYY